MKTRIFNLVLAMCFCCRVFAYDFAALDLGRNWHLYFNIIDEANHYVEVTCPGEVGPLGWEHQLGPLGVLNLISGTVLIPSTVTYNNIQYIVTAIGDYGFCDTDIKNVTLPNTITAIGDYAFYSTLLTTLTIPNSVTQIGKYAFYECKNMADLNLGESVTTIGDYAFSKCTKISNSLTIPNSVTHIGDYAFSSSYSYINQSHNNLPHLYLSESVRTIGNHAFDGCDGFEGNLTIGDSLMAIGNSVFKDCRYISSLDIGNSITAIGDSAFYNCERITGNLVLPNSVTSIGNYAFYGCEFFGNLVLPNSVTYIGNHAFYYCNFHANANTVLPNSVTYIGNSAFCRCLGVSGELTIPNSVTYIGNSAFSECFGITGTLVIPNSVTAIEPLTFYHTNISEVIIGDSVLAIGSSAFHLCPLLASLTIGKMVNYIGNQAFSPYFDWSSLSSITIKSPIPPVLEEDAFLHVSEWTDITVPCGSGQIYSHFAGWDHFRRFTEVYLADIVVSSSNEELGNATVTCYPSCQNHTTTVSATPTTGNIFLNWAENGEVISCDNPYSFSADSDKTLVANFHSSTFAIEALSNPVIGGVVDGGESYNLGETVTLTAMPAEGYCFANWTESGEVVSSENPYTFTLTGNRSLTANFTPGYPIIAAANPTEGGIIEGTGVYPINSLVTLNAIPNEGYKFVNWMENGIQVSTNQNLPILVTSSRSFVANFNVKTYTISATVNPMEGGTINGMGNYTHGTMVTLNAIANDGYSFLCWEENGASLSLDESFSFPATSDMTLEAVFYQTDINKPEGAIDGLFSISANKQVYFSKGNLQYNAMQGEHQCADNTNKQGTWRFADEQYDFMGLGNKNISSTYDGWIDLFGWGTSGWNSGAVCYQPWSNSNINTDYYPGGNCYNNLTGDYANADWGIYNSILNGNNIPGYWRCLSADEWIYVLNNRNLASEKKALGTVDGVGGLILLPDNWICPSGISFIPGIENSTANVYSILDWALMEASGAVFLPSARFRYGLTVSNNITNNAGNYWTSTANNNSYARNLYFYESSAGYGVGDRDQSYGLSVRLVRDYYDSYAISASANPAVGGTVMGTGVFTQGTNVTLSASANEGYTFINWTENGTEVSTNPTYSFTATADRTLVANFNLNSYAINTTANPAIGGTVTGAGNYNHGANVTLSASANEGYTFVNWTENGTEVSTSPTYTFTATAGRTMVANFSLNSYAITATASPAVGGTVTGAGSYDHGENVTLSASANEGYTFVNWTENGTEISTSPTYGFIATSERTLTANFSQNSYAITATASPAVGGTVTGAGNYNYGSSCMLTATPSNGYIFINWTKDGVEVSVNPSYSFTVMENANYVANFEEQGPITNHWTIIGGTQYNMTISGIIYIDGIEQMVNTLEVGAFCGDECRGSMMPEFFPPSSQFVVALTVVSNQLSGENITFRLYDHATEQELDLQCANGITFENNAIIGIMGDWFPFAFNSEVSVTASVNPVGAGAVTGTGNFMPGTTATLTAIANEGYAFSSWSIGGETVSTDNPYTFTVTAATELVANFAHVHTSNLSSGWNWWSTYIEQDGINGLSMLEQSLGHNGLMIKTQVPYVQNYYPQTGYDYWFGSLTNVGLTNEAGYQISVSSNCQVMMNGAEANPSQHPITIQSGWNWIGYPVTVQQSLSNGLSGFTPMTNDLIKGQGSSATYYANYGWFPTSFTLTPGQSYMYFSNASQSQTLTYNIGRGSESIVESPNRIWTNDIHAHAGNIVVIATVTIDGEEQQSDNLELGAFVNGECRGSAVLQYFEPTDRWYAMLTVSGEEGETVTFAAIKRRNGTVDEGSSKFLTYYDNAIIGSLDEPFEVHFGTTELLHIYPNPVERNMSFMLDIPSDETVVDMEVCNVLGDVVFHKTGAVNDRQMHGFTVTGVYIVKAVCSFGKVYIGRLIVK